MVNIDKNLLRGVSNCRCVLMFAPSRCRRRSKHGVVHRASFHPERSSTATGSDHPRCPQRSGPSFTFLSRAPRGPNVAGWSISLHLGRSMPLDPVGIINSLVGQGPVPHHPVATSCTDQRRPPDAWQRPTPRSKKRRCDQTEITGPTFVPSLRHS
jgi:hypothetical protein